MLALGLGLSGCGGTASPAQDEEPAAQGAVAAPDRAARECRAQWLDLGKQVEGRDRPSTPSALPRRWTNVVATIDYYAAAATEDDCGAALESQEQAIADLAAFSGRLAPYDMERRLGLVRSEARAYANGPRPPAPKNSRQGKAGAKKGRAARPPKPADVAAALRTLTRQAPRATQQQGPAWQQARVVDLGDEAAVRKAVKDLAFLSSESAAYRAAGSALREIREALRASS